MGNGNIIIPTLDAQGPVHIGNMRPGNMNEAKKKSLQHDSGAIE